MKVLFPLIVAYLIAIPSFGQSANCQYRIVKIEGKWFERTSKKPVKVGTIAPSIRLEDYQVQQTPEASMTLMSSQCGEMRLFKPSSSGARIMTALVNYFDWELAMQKRGALGRRSIDKAEYLRVLQRVFVKSDSNTTTNFLILGDSASYPIDKAFFPQHEDAYFAVRFRYRQQPVTNRLGHLADSLQLKRGVVYKVDSQLIAPEEATDMELVYYIIGSDGHITPTLIGPFHPYFETDLNRIALYQELIKKL